MQRSLTHTSKSFVPQSMAPNQFLFACLRIRLDMTNGADWSKRYPLIIRDALKTAPSEPLRKRKEQSRELLRSRPAPKVSIVRGS